MGFDMSAMAGNRSGWYGGESPQRTVTDLTAHVDGGPPSSHRSNATTSDTGNLHDAVAIVVIAMVLLWLLGGLSFRSHNL